MSLVKKAISEFFGTFILVLIGCGTACAVGCDAKLGAGYLITALAFGVGLIAACYSVGNLSGCHINPAVSLSKLITGTLKPRTLARHYGLCGQLPYVVHDRTSGI